MTTDAAAPPPSSDRLRWLRLLQLASPALPIGAFAYSQGLEAAVTAGLVHDEASAGDWIEGLLRGPLAQQDLPIFARLHAAHAAGEDGAADRWNAFLLATRPTTELQMEDRHLGAALARVLATLEVPPSGGSAAAGPPTLASQFARGAAAFGIDLRTSTETFAFTWAEAQASAAVRLVPLGQTAGVRIVARAAAVIADAVLAALDVADDDLGGAAPGLALLSAAHETQYSRLFRS
jgi:urease accessory protein